MANCPHCGYSDAYIGFTAVECKNPSCTCYKPVVPLILDSDQRSKDDTDALPAVNDYCSYQQMHNQPTLPGVDWDLSADAKTETMSLYMDDLYLGEFTVYI